MDIPQTLESKPVIDAPESSDDNEQPDSNLQNIGTSPAATDATSSDSKQQQPKQNRNYADYVMRPLKAVGRGLLAVVDWTDKNNGFVTALATVVIAILTGIYVHYSRAQWKVMRDQLGEMTNTRLQAKEDNASAIAAQQAVAQTALKTSQENFAKSFKSSEDQLRLDQRAWVGVEAVQIDQFDLNTLFEAQLRFLNSGKTPALHFKSAMGFRITTKFIDGPDADNVKALEKDFHGNNVVAPQVRTIIHANDLAWGMNEIIINGVRMDGLHFYYQQLRDQTIYFFLYGEIRYDDISGRQRTTKWCSYLRDTAGSTKDPAKWGLTHCNTFNEMS